ncbi:G-protein coupled receptor GRL101 [Stylophora pistillata]|uniref:G-protein coupled receptor GRL101 n=1 Tax=Stylophora pistillata TaxID=50429 RepID=A0A2B4R878_STYPI|nr:G-protein coupled receptor GRL101 [Stylophora pistillata]
MFEKPRTFSSPRVIIVGFLGSIQNEKNTKNVVSEKKNIKALKLRALRLYIYENECNGKHRTLDFNKLETLPSDLFKAHKLYDLDLSYNKLSNLSRGVLSTNTKLKELNIENNSLTAVSPDQFQGLSKLKDLAVHDNNIEYLPRGVFKDTKQIMSMSFHLNKITEVTNEQFKDVAPTIRFLTLDTNLMCCHFKKDDADCDFTYVDSFASWETMFRDPAPRKCIWVIGIMSLIGAVFVITWRMLYSQRNIEQPIMLMHLAVSDGLMGVYLIIIGWKDAIWAGQYYLHDYKWRSSLSCQITGAIAVLSSEVSIMLLSLISADRLKNIVFPFYVGGLTNKTTHALCFTIWTIGFIIAFLPTFGIQYFETPKGQYFYGRSVVCLPLQLSHDKAPGWEYSLAVFVGLNLAFLTFVIVAYLVILVNRCQVQAMSANTQRETALAKRVFFIILTDCICWMPVIVIGLRSIAEKSFSTRGDLAVWIAVFVLPLNSAINPILYTLSTTQVRDVLKGKWQQLCNYFRAKCSRTQTGEGPDKEAQEEPEKEQQEVHKHDHSCVEHTGLQDTCKGQLNTKRKEPAKPGQPDTEPTDSTDKITPQSKKTDTEDHRQSQKDVAANSEYEEPHIDLKGYEDQSSDEVQIQHDPESDDSDDNDDESKDQSEHGKIVEQINHEEPEGRDETEQGEKLQDDHEDPSQKKGEPEEHREELENYFKGSEEQYEDDLEDESDKKKEVSENDYKEAEEQDVDNMDHEARKDKQFIVNKADKHQADENLPAASGRESLRAPLAKLDDDSDLDQFYEALDDIKETSV